MEWVNGLEPNITKKGIYYYYYWGFVFENDFCVNDGLGWASCYVTETGEKFAKRGLLSMYEKLSKITAPSNETGGP